jgi:hypothetical protein
MKTILMSIFLVFMSQMTKAQESNSSPPLSDLKLSVAFANDFLKYDNSRAACVYIGMAQVYLDSAARTVGVLRMELPEVEFLNRQFCRGEMPRNKAKEILSTLAQKLSYH